MRVYTDTAIRNVINYGKLFLGLAVLFVLLSQAVKIWGNDPSLQELRNLMQPGQTEQQ